MTRGPYDTRAWRDEVRPAVLVRDGHCCTRCRRHVADLAAGECLIVDHVISWADGGAWYDPANLQTLCSPCSGRKDGPRSRRRPGPRRGMVAAR